MKNNVLMRKLFSDIRLNREGFLAVWLTFTVGIMFYNATYPAGSNFVASVYRFFDRTHLADLWYEFDAAPADVLETVRGVDGVQAASGRLQVEMGLDRDGAGALVTVRLISLPESEADVNNMVIVEGRAPQNDNEIVLTQAFARAQNIPLESDLRLTGSVEWPVRVVGFVASSEYLIGSRSPLQPFPTLSTFGVGYATYNALAQQISQAGEINSIGLTVTPGANLNAVRARVTAILQPYTLRWVMDRHQQPAFATLKANMDSNTSVGLIFSFVFLFGSGAIMAVLLARQVDSERRVIGTLRALGYARGEVLSYYLAFGLLIAVAGVLVGTPLGYAITWPILQFFQDGLVGAPVPELSNPPDAAFMLFGAVTGFVLALVAAAVPAWRAAATDPGLALRPPTPAGLGGQARWTIPGLSLTGKQAVRNLLRAPGRTLSTVIGVICGLAIIVMGLATWDNLDYNFRAFYDSRRFDFIVTTGQVGMAAALKNAAASVEGVTGVETGLVAPVTVTLAERTYTAIGLVLDDEQNFIAMDAIQGVPFFNGSEGVWIGHNLARTLNAQAGDTLTVTAEGITKTVIVRGIVKQVLGAPMYVPMSLFSQWTPLGVHPANQAYVRADPARRLEVQRALNALPGVIGVEDWQSTTQDIQRAADFNGNFAIIFLGFGLFLTFVVLFNTISANLRERQNELVIMRMQGLFHHELRSLVTWETLIAAWLGMLLGVIPTLLLVDYVIQLYNTDVAGNLTTIYPPTWVIAIVTLALIALVSQVFPLRRIYALNMGDVSKSVNV